MEYSINRFVQTADGDFTAAGQIQQRIGESVIVGNHGHIHPGHHRHTGGIPVVFGHPMHGHQLENILPVRNHQALKAQFLAQQTSQNLGIGVHRYSVEFTGIDHEGECTGLDTGLEGGKKNFP